MPLFRLFKVQCSSIPCHLNPYPYPSTLHVPVYPSDRHPDPRCTRLPPDSQGTLGNRFSLPPWDLDMFGEMNNGRVLTLYDLGRFDLVIRTGFMKIMRAQRWGLVVAGASVRYRRRVRLFDRVRLRTQIVGFDQRWIYIVQSMWVGGQPTSPLCCAPG
ncbi:MAG: acyl-CoA thioesterase [Thiolinea sp.]